MTEKAPGNGPYQVKLVRNIRIPMADGLTLAVDLYLPDIAAGANERFPAIIEYTPYHKVNNSFYGPRATRYPYFASHGYVFVNVDIRGTGDSAGCNTSMTSPEEIRDGLEVIRWCANQDWSTGDVGMIGISYTAGVCYDAARQSPPELKAIVLCQMCSDWYDGMACPGGTPRPFAYENYAPLMAAYNFAPPDPDIVGSDWSKLWQERLEGSIPWGKTYIENLLDGPFWEERLLRGQEEKVTAATYLIGGWCDWYPDDFLKVFTKLKCPKRCLIGPWTHNYPENAWPLPRINDRYECLRWFDKYLKGRDTDTDRPVDQDPPLTMFIREFTPPAPLRREDAGRFQFLPWPLEDTNLQIHYLRDDAKLTSEVLQNCSEAGTGMSQHSYRPDIGIAAGRYVIGQMLPGWGMADDQRLDEGLSLVYTGEPFTRCLDFVGNPAAHFWVSSTAPVAFLSVKLCDVAPDGTSVLVTKGVLNLTHRISHQQPELLTPGEVYEINLPLPAIGYRMLPGHRWRLLIAAADFQNAWPTPLPHTLTVYHSADQPSRLELPVADNLSNNPAPVFYPSEFAPLPQDQLPTPTYVISRDMIRGTVTVEINTQAGVGINHSRYTVNLHRPADAVVDSEYDYLLKRTGLEVKVHATCVTRSDATTFHHLTNVDIKLNERPFWQKQWTVSVPRQGN